MSGNFQVPVRAVTCYYRYKRESCGKKKVQRGVMSEILSYNLFESEET